jgi:hypothetical protein
MTIRLFQDPSFTGARTVITGVGAAEDLVDAADLKDFNGGRKPSSLRTSSGDAALLCSKPDWKGEIMYLRNQRNIRDLGDPATGGRRGFRNAVRSVRVRPFLIAMNITIVTGSDGTLPGGWEDRTQAERDMDLLIVLMNDFFRRERCLIRVKWSDITYRPSEEYFNVSIREYRPVPAKWKKPKSVDVVLVNRIANAIGVGSFPWHGKHVLVAMERMAAALERAPGTGPGTIYRPGNPLREVRDPRLVDAFLGISRTWVHELGHYWGLRHQDPITQDTIDAVARINPSLAAAMRTSDSNIMIQSGKAGPFSVATMTSSQLNEVHQVLARNLSRKGDRQETIPDALV